MTTRALSGALLADRYRLAEILRETRTTTVFAAIDMRVGTRLEVEVLTAPGEASAASARALESRAALAAELGHPVVVAPRDVGLLADGSPFVVRPRREGPTLDDRVCLGGPLAPIDVVRLALELGSALAAAHERGLHHGAIAPEHVVLVERDGVLLGVTLEGFGEGAPLIDDHATLGFSRLAFVAPERLDAATSADAAPTVASDLFALAAVLAFAATGCSPEASRRGAGAFGLFPSRITRVLLRAMHPEPAHRYASAQELIGTFLALREGAVSDEPPTRRSYASGTFAKDEHTATLTETSAVRTRPPLARTAT